MNFSHMKKILDFVEHFHKSPQKTENLLNIPNGMASEKNCDRVRVVQDFIKRWWITFRTIKRILRLKPARTALKADDVIPREKWLTELDWEVIFENERSSSTLCYI